MTIQGKHVLKKPSVKRVGVKRARVKATSVKTSSVKQASAKSSRVKRASVKNAVMKKSTSSMSTPSKSFTGKRAFVIDEDLRKMIRKEAASLKMSEEEFLRLLVHFSEVMRTSIVPAGLLDGGILQMMLSNPMAMGMLKNVIGNMFSKFGGGNSSATGNAAPGNVMPGARPGGPLGGMGGTGMGGMGNQMMQQFQRMPGTQGMPSGVPWMGQRGGAGQLSNPMGNPMGNMMYGMNGPAMNYGGQQRPMQGMPGMGMNPSGSHGQGQSSGGGLSNLFNMDNLTNMFSQFFGNQTGATT